MTSKEQEKRDGEDQEDPPAPAHGGLDEATMRRMARQVGFGLGQSSCGPAG